MRISDWSSDVCSSDLFLPHPHHPGGGRRNPLSVTPRRHHRTAQCHALARRHAADRRIIFRTAAPHAFRRATAGASLAPAVTRGSAARAPHPASQRSEEHTSELQSLMRISYAVFCLKNKKHKKDIIS